MDCTKLPEPEPVQLAKSKYIYDTVPYQLFIKEYLLPSEKTDDNGETNFSPQLKWRRMPIEFVYALYSKWHITNYQRKPVETITVFKNRLSGDANLYNVWDVSLRRETWSKKDITDPKKEAAAKAKAKKKREEQKAALANSNENVDTDAPESDTIMNGFTVLADPMPAILAKVESIEKTSSTADDTKESKYVNEPLISVYNIKEWKNLDKNKLSERFYGFITSVDYDTYYD